MNEFNRIIDDNDEKYIERKALEIFNKISDMPFEEETTIATLDDYNPDEEFVSPLMQGKIFYLIEVMCQKNNVKIECIYDDTRGGLAYYDKFKKLK